MVGYGPEDAHFVVELTYNYGVGEYRLGNDFLVSVSSRQGPVPVGSPPGRPQAEAYGRAWGQRLLSSCPWVEAGFPR